MPDFLPITTERLVIGRLEPGHAEAFAAYRSDPDVARYQSWATPYPVSSAQRLIEGQATLTGPTAGEWFQLAITRDGLLVGDVAVELSTDGDTATIGYTVAPSEQGRGIAREAVGAVVDRLFEHVGVHRVQASLDPRNIASARVVELLGFEYEGTARSSVRDDAGWADDAHYALTAEDRKRWKARPHDPPRDVRLIAITPEMSRPMLHLATHRSQERFVAPMAGSFANALVPEVVDGAPVVPWFRAIEADGELAGFVMLAERTSAHPEAYLWRLLVDRRHQRRGIGRRVMQQLFDQLRAEGHTSLVTSWVPAPDGPEPFYQGLGFVPTGELDDDEVVARVAL